MVGIVSKWCVFCPQWWVDFLSAGYFLPVVGVLPQLWVLCSNGGCCVQVLGVLPQLWVFCKLVTTREQ